MTEKRTYLRDKKCCAFTVVKREKKIVLLKLLSHLQKEKRKKSKWQVSTFYLYFWPDKQGLQNIASTELI